MLGHIFVVVKDRSVRVFFSGHRSQRGGGGAQGGDEVSEFGTGVGGLLGLKRGAYNETGPGFRMRVNVCNKCLRLVGDGLIGAGMVTSFFSSLVVNWE